MITTLNRLEELKRTLKRIETMSPAPAEVWTVADGCTDGTVAYVQKHHPQVNLIVHEKPKGSVESRAKIMNRATGDLVLALDDDSYPEQVDCLERLRILFENRPQLAIATFPQRTDEFPETLEQQDFGPEAPVRSFPNSGACLRLATYRTLPGFEPMFFHSYEEPDYALQCVANGWEVVRTPIVTIRHHYSGLERNERRTHHRHARNEFWSTAMRCPLPQAVVIAGYRVFSQACYAISRGPAWLIWEPVWWWQALIGLPQVLRRRRVLSWHGYKQWLRLGRN